MSRDDILGAVYDVARKNGQCLHDLEPEAVDAIIALVRSDEREACAKLADGLDTGRRLTVDRRAQELAARIRARGKQ